jgi:2-methylcitrate dehydratase PrpD
VPGVTVLHGNAPILPAAVAVGEWQDASGADLALAIARGFEVAARVALAAGSAMFGRYHVTGLVAGFGAAAAAAGRLLGLDVQQFTYALGIAKAQAGATGQYLGTMTKPQDTGPGAMSGVHASLLAQEDSRVPRTRSRVRPGSTTHFRATATSRRCFELGQRWELRRAAFKPYACGVVQHALLDGVVRLREEYRLQRDDVEAVERRVNPHALRATGPTDPQTHLESKSVRITRSP